MIIFTGKFIIIDTKSIDENTIRIYCVPDEKTKERYNIEALMFESIVRDDLKIGINDIIQFVMCDGVSANDEIVKEMYYIDNSKGDSRDVKGDSSKDVKGDNKDVKSDSKNIKDYERKDKNDEANKDNEMTCTLIEMYDLALTCECIELNINTTDNLFYFFLSAGGLYVLVTHKNKDIKQFTKQGNTYYSLINFA